MTSDNHKKPSDKKTEVKTTGHEWDGIQEFNNPAPRWWLMVWGVCIVFAIGYMVLYPAWPTFSGEGERGATPGTLGWTQYKQLKDSQKAINSRKGEYLAKFSSASFEDIEKDPELYAFAIAGGKVAFKDNCAMCHGSGGAGGPGYPNLNDDDWLWGGTTDDIYTTIKYGIRSEHDETRSSMMSEFDGVLEDSEIAEVADYVLNGANNSEHAGAAIFAENCAACHGEDAKGMREMGAPNLVDAIWLRVEPTVAGISSQVKHPTHGLMPTWEGRLDDNTIRQLTVYVHSLGGGE